MLHLNLVTREFGQVVLSQAVFLAAGGDHGARLHEPVRLEHVVHEHGHERGRPALQLLVQHAVNLELVRVVHIAVGVRVVAEFGHEVHLLNAAPRAVVVALDFKHGVGAHHELELRHEGDHVLVEGAALQRVAGGHLLQHALVDLVPLGRLLHDGVADADELRNLGRRAADAVAFVRDERDGHGGLVFAEAARHEFREFGLAVAARAHVNLERLVAVHADQARRQMVPHVSAQLLNGEQLLHEVVDFGHCGGVFGAVQRHVVNVGAFADVVVGLAAAEALFREINDAVAVAHEVRVGVQRVHEVAVVKQLARLFHDVVLERGGFQPHADLGEFLGAHALVLPAVAAGVFLVHERRVFNLLGVVHVVDVLGNHEAQRVAGVALLPPGPVERVPRVRLDADAHELVLGVVVDHVRQVHVGGFLGFQRLFHVVLVRFAADVVVCLARVGFGPEHDGALGEAAPVRRRVHAELLPLVVEVNDHVVGEFGGLGAERNPREEQVRARVAQRPTHADPLRLVVVVRGGQAHGVFVRFAQLVRLLLHGRIQLVNRRVQPLCVHNVRQLNDFHVRGLEHDLRFGMCAIRNTSSTATATSSATSQCFSPLFGHANGLFDCGVFGLDRIGDVKPGVVSILRSEELKIHAHVKHGHAALMKSQRAVLVQIHDVPILQHVGLVSRLARPVQLPVCGSAHDAFVQHFVPRICEGQIAPNGRHLREHAFSQHDLQRPVHLHADEDVKAVLRRVLQQIHVRFFKHEDGQQRARREGHQIGQLIDDHFHHVGHVLLRVLSDFHRRVVALVNVNQSRPVVGQLPLRQKLLTPLNEHMVRVFPVKFADVLWWNSVRTSVNAQLLTSNTRVRVLLPFFRIPLLHEHIKWHACFGCC